MNSSPKPAVEFSRQHRSLHNARQRRIQLPELTDKRLARGTGRKVRFNLLPPAGGQLIRFEIENLLFKFFACHKSQKNRASQSVRLGQVDDGRTDRRIDWSQPWKSLVELKPLLSAGNRFAAIPFSRGREAS